MIYKKLTKCGFDSNNVSFSKDWSLESRANFNMRQDMVISFPAAAMQFKLILSWDEDEDLKEMGESNEL